MKEDRIGRGGCCGGFVAQWLWRVQLNTLSLSPAVVSFLSSPFFPSRLSSNKTSIMIIFLFSLHRLRSVMTCSPSLSMSSPLLQTQWYVHVCTYVLIQVHYNVLTYSPTCLVGTLEGTPNLYFLSEVLTISTG